MTRIYKVTLSIVDHGNLGEDGIRDAIEYTRYPNYCINPKVICAEFRDVEWEDNHPMNHSANHVEEFKKLFS